MFSLSWQNSAIWSCLLFFFFPTGNSRKGFGFHPFRFLVGLGLTYPLGRFHSLRLPTRRITRNFKQTSSRRPPHNTKWQQSLRRVLLLIIWRAEFLHQVKIKLPISSQHHIVSLLLSFSVYNFCSIPFLSFICWCVVGVFFFFFIAFLSLVLPLQVHILKFLHTHFPEICMFSGRRLKYSYSGASVVIIFNYYM